MMCVTRNPRRNLFAATMAGLLASAVAMTAAVAQEAADDIAARFAADGDPDTSQDAATGTREGNGGSEDGRTLIDEAREAVERALERAKETSDAAPSGDTPGASAPTATDTPQPQPTASKANEETSGPKEDLAERLRRIRRDRAAENAHQAEKPDAASPAPDEKAEDSVINSVMSRIATKAAGYISPLVEKHVTVLLIMDVGDKGVRRWSKTADPMICVHENCFISRGADQSAEKLTREAAFGPTVALAKRGGACRSSPACIFRDVDLETVEAKLQPVDLKFLKHDRRDAAAIRADTTCAVLSGALSCRSPIVGDSWRAWVVPESVAREAGALGLQAALDGGLK